VDRRIRVVVISDFGDVTGGAAKVAITSARGLAERGNRVVFVCAIRPVSPLLHHANIDVRCFDVPAVWATRNPFTAALRGVWNADAAHKLDELLRDENPDETIIHFHQWTKAFSPSVIAVAEAGGFHHVFSMHDYFLFCPNGAYFHFPRERPCTLRPLSVACATANCDSRSYAFKVVRLVRQTAMAGAVRRRRSSPLNVIHVSSFAQTVARPLLPPGARHFVVRNPVDVEQKAPAPVGANTSFVFVGRFTSEKQCTLFAQAAQLAGVPATFLGEGPEEQAIRRVNPQARVLPWGDETIVDGVLSGARALVFPSVWYETSGLVVAEALARGVPAIVSRVTGACDLIQEGVNGLLCQPGDLAGLTTSIRRLQDGHEAERLGRNAFTMYWERPLSVSAHVDRLIAVYQTIRAGVTYEPSAMTNLA
jgi:glycosyltransferase involved in cell wall biosynthesis